MKKSRFTEEQIAFALRQGGWPYSTLCQPSGGRGHLSSAGGKRMAGDSARGVTRQRSMGAARNSFRVVPSEVVSCRDRRMAADLALLIAKVGRKRSA